MITLALLLGGGYARIEKLATLKVALFTMLTFLCALLMLRMPQWFSWERLLDGLKLRMPGEGLATAVITAFTGYWIVTQFLPGIAH